MRIIKVQLHSVVIALIKTLPYLNVQTLFTYIAYQCICHFYTLGLKTSSHSVLNQATFDKHKTIFLLNQVIYFTALIANTFDSASRQYCKMAWKNYIPPTSSVTILVFICAMNFLPLSVAFDKSSTECCETNGVPDMCLGFCFLAAEPQLLLRLGPCENHKIMINRCKLV